MLFARKMTTRLLASCTSSCTPPSPGPANRLAGRPATASCVCEPARVCVEGHSPSTPHLPNSRSPCLRPVPLCSVFAACFIYPHMLSLSFGRASVLFWSCRVAYLSSNYLLLVAASLRTFRVCTTCTRVCNFFLFFLSLRVFWESVCCGPSFFPPPVLLGSLACVT